jgi:hypothetical protein
MIAIVVTCIAPGVVLALCLAAQVERLLVKKAG